MIRHLTSLLVLFLWALISSGQISIANGGTIDITCGEEIAFTDSDADGDLYGASEISEITICPDGGNAVYIRISTDVGDLWDVDGSDQLTIFDGPDTSAPVIGTYNSVSDPNGIIIATSTNNLSGCMTFQFISDGSVEGQGWAGIISCGLAWQPYSVEISSNPLDGDNDPGYIDICPGETIDFSVAGEYPNSTTGTNGYEQTNANTYFLWQMGEGTIFEGEGLTNTSFTYNDQFGYNVVVTATDIQGQVEIDTIKVRVSTTPGFLDVIALEDPICLGASTEIVGGFVDSDISAGFEEEEGSFYVGGISSGQFHLPDGSGVNHTDTITIANIDPTTTIDEISDFVQICVDIEHSFLGDLEMGLTCPSGEEVIIFNGYNGATGMYDDGFGGGATYLGNALDNSTFTPGEGWQYCWSMDAEFGTFPDEFAAMNFVPTDMGQAMAPGTYLPETSFADFIGCPVAGDWVITIRDNIGIDDGYVFGWEIVLDPSLYPEPEFYTPQIVTAEWNDDPTITGVDDLAIEVTPDQTGFVPYTFTVADNFGCSWDTTVTVQVVETPVVFAGDDLFLSCSDDFLNGTINGLSQPTCDDVAGSYTYCYEDSENTTITYCPDNPGDGISLLTITFNAGSIENFFDQLSIYDGPDASSPVLAGPIEGDLTSLSFTATNDGCLTLVFTSDGSVSCESGSQDEWQYDISCTAGDDYVLEWQPAEFLDDNTVSNPALIGVDTDTEFTLTAFPAIAPQCIASDDVLVIVADAPSPGEDANHVFCPTDGDQQMFDLLGGVPDIGGVWTDEYGDEIDDPTFSPSEDADGIFTYAIPGCNVSAELDLSVNHLSLDAGQDTTICIGGTATLSVEMDVDPDGDETFEWNGGQYFGQQIEVASNDAQELSVIAYYGAGCVTEPDLVEVLVYDPLSFDMPVDETICFGDEITLSPSVVQGGLAPYQYEWDGSGASGETDITVSPSTETEYCLTLSDACESPVYSDCVTISLEEILNAGFDADTLNGCFPIQVNFVGSEDNVEGIAGVQWDFGDGSSSNSIGSATHVYSTPGEYDVSYTILSVAGCTYSSTEEDMIYAYPYPVASFTAEEEEVTLPWTTFDFINLSLDYSFNEWDFAGLGVSNEDEPTFEFPADIPNLYPITLTVTNLFGCVDSLTRNVEVIQNYEIYAPNAFTPDGDGYNEVWHIETIDVDPNRFELTIFNRWGDVVFYTTDFNEVWDGSHQQGGYYCPDGVYVYHIVGHSLSYGEQKELFGHINLLR